MGEKTTMWISKKLKAWLAAKVKNDESYESIVKRLVGYKG